MKQDNKTKQEDKKPNEPAEKLDEYGRLIQQGTQHRQQRRRKNWPSQSQQKPQG